MSDSFPPHELQHASPPCPSPSPRVCPGLCSLYWWCRPAISSSDCQSISYSDILFSFCSWSFPASGTFSMSRLFTSDDRNTMLSVQFSSVAQSCPTLCNPMNCSTPGLPAHHQLPEFTQTHVHQVSDAIHPSHLLSSASPPALHLSQHQGLFQWVRSLYPVAKGLEFQLQHQSFLNEYSGLISFKIDWLDFLAVQGTLKSLLQRRSSKGSILQRSVFFIVQLSHPYMITGKTIALTRQTFVGKVMSLL